MTTKTTKPSYQEWLKANPLKCKECEVLLPTGFKAYVDGSINRLLDVDYEKIRGYFCSDCFEVAEQELVESRFVEEYKGNSIYCKDGGYYSYWHAPYYFKTLEECKIRIDSPHIAIMPWGIAPILGGSL